MPSCEAVGVDVGKLLIDNKNRASVVLERQMLYLPKATYTLDPKFKVKQGTKEKREGIKMRRVVVLALLALVLPVAAWADGITLTNQFGSIAISTAGISSHGSQLTSWGDRKSV